MSYLNFLLYFCTFHMTMDFVMTEEDDVYQCKHKFKENRKYLVLVKTCHYQ